MKFKNTIKQNLKLILFLSFMVFVMIPSAAMAFTVAIHDTTGDAGSSVNIPVYLVPDEGNTSGIFAVEMTITFSNTFLTATGIETTGSLTDTWETQFNASPGKIQFSLAGTDSIVTNEGILFFLTFQVSASAYSYQSSWIDFSTVLFNEDITDITTDGGYFSVNYIPKITISPDEKTLYVGQTQQFTVGGDETPPFEWGVTDSTVASIDTTGTLTALMPGVCRVFVNDNTGLVDTTGTITIRACNLSFPDSTVNINAVFDLPVIITDITPYGMVSFEISLTYNTSYLEVVGFTDLPSITSGWGELNISIKPGLINISGGSANPLTGSGPLFYIRFHAIKSTYSTAIEFEKALFNESMPAVTQSGYIKINSLPTLYISPSSGELVLGDSLDFNVSGGTGPYEWTSLDESIGTIDEDGLFKSTGAGTVHINVVDIPTGSSKVSGPIVVHGFTMKVSDASCPKELSVEVPIVVGNVTGFGITSFEFVVNIDTSRVHVDDISTNGTMIEDWSGTIANIQDGIITIASAGIDPIEGEGTLLNLTLSPNDSSPDNSYTNIQLVDVVINEGIPSASFSGGRFDILPVLEILDPPTTVFMFYELRDEKHTFRLTWEPSASEGYGLVSHYRIYRSGSSELTDPVPLTDFPDTASFLAWEENYAVLMDSVEAGIYEYIDDYVLVSGNSYYYWVQAVGSIGGSIEVAAEPGVGVHDENIPDQFRVNPPFPNPFNPSTTISYELHREANVNIIIYDITGRKIAVLEDAVKSAGLHNVLWHGKTDEGWAVASGLYIFQIQAGNHKAHGKLMLIR